MFKEFKTKEKNKPEYITETYVVSKAQNIIWLCTEKVANP